MDSQRRGDSNAGDQPHHLLENNIRPQTSRGQTNAAGLAANFHYSTNRTNGVNQGIIARLQVGTCTYRLLVDTGAEVTLLKEFLP